MASESPASVFRSVDISSERSVLHIATTLRRLWLVDPSSPVLATKLEAQQNGEHDHSNCEDHDHDHDRAHGHEHDGKEDNSDAHSADLEHDHANCSGHDHSHSHSHSHATEGAEADSDDEADDHGSDCDCGEDHDENDPHLQIFPVAFETVASHIGDAPDEDKYLDAKWKSATDLKLMSPPAGPPFTEETTESDDEEAIQSSLFTPFRQQIYGIYNHIFYHAYTTLKEKLAEEKAVAIGEFKPPSTTVMVLEAPDEGDEEGIPHDFEEDTFVYPVWVAEGTKLRLSFEGKTVEFGAQGEKWTEVLMFRAGTSVTIVPEAAEGELGTGVVGLLAMGICEAVEA